MRLNSIPLLLKIATRSNKNYIKTLPCSARFSFCNPFRKAISFPFCEISKSSLFELNKQLLGSYVDIKTQHEIRVANKNLLDLCAEQTRKLFGDEASEGIQIDSFVRNENNIPFQSIIYNILTIGYKARQIKKGIEASEEYRIKLGLISLSLDFAGIYMDLKIKYPLSLEEQADAEFFEAFSKTFGELIKEASFKFRLQEVETNTRLVKSFINLLENLETLLLKMKTGLPLHPGFIEIVAFIHDFSRVCASALTMDLVRLFNSVMNVYCLLRPNSSLNFRKNPRSFLSNDNEQFILWAKNINLKKKKEEENDQQLQPPLSQSSADLLSKVLYSLAEKLQARLEDKTINTFKGFLDHLKPVAFQGLCPNADTILYYLDNVVVKEFRDLNRQKDFEESGFFELFSELLELFPLLNTESDIFDDLQIHMCKTLFLIGGSVLNSPFFFKRGNSQMIQLIMLLFKVFQRRKVIDYDLLQQIERILVNLIQSMRPSTFIQLMKFFSQAPLFIDLRNLKHQVLYFAKAKFHTLDKEQLIDLGTAFIKCSFMSEETKEAKSIDILRLIDLDWWVRLTESLIGIRRIELSDVQKVKLYLLLNLMKRTFGDLWNEALEKKMSSLYFDFATIIEQTESAFQKKIEEHIKNAQATYITEPIVDSVFSVDFLLDEGNKAAIIEADGPAHFYAVILENAQFKNKKETEMVQKIAEYLPDHNIFAFFENRNTALKRFLLHELGYPCLNISVFDLERFSPKHLFNIVLEFTTKKCDKKDLITYKKL